MMQIDRDCFNRIVRLLTAYMDIPATRQAILQMAWYGSPLLHQVNWTGNPRTFTTLLVRKAIDFGQVAPDVHSLVALMEGLRAEVGYDVQAEIDDILQNCLSVTAQPQTNIVPQLPPSLPAPCDKHLFISYASHDRHSFVSRLASDLQAKQYKIWVDNLGPQYGGITAGQSWQQELANALACASHVIYVMSPDSLKSLWCRAELQRASEQKTPIIPLLIRPLSADDRQMLNDITVGNQKLADIQYRSVVDLGYDTAFDTLLDDLTRN